MIDIDLGLFITSLIALYKRRVVMINDNIIEWIIKLGGIAAFVVNSKALWRALWVSVALFFWRKELKFGLIKLRDWIVKLQRY
jgi:hypothetical protein